jgi:hypothetical protein
MFLRDIKWDDDYVLEVSDLRRAHLQLAMYAIHLGSGSTLYCRRIKTATVKKYILNIASFISIFTNRDPRKSNATDSRLSPVITSVFDELQRWEDVPNRREPFTIEMLHEVHRLIILEQSHPDSLIVALADWFLCGLFTGFRLSEYAQDTMHPDPRFPGMNDRGDTCALLLGDVRFQLFDGRRISADLLPSVPLISIWKVWVTWRTQKNGQNGENRLFTQNKNLEGHCMLRALHRIILRFLRLLGPDNVTPLALYAPYPGATRLITSSNIEILMRRVAATVYNLDPIKNRKELQRWSAHSLRVGACVILHAMGFTGTQIKWILRWKSDAFMVYLRNLAILADQHNAVFDEASTMPNFL